MLLMILPLLSYSGNNYSTLSGLREIFWFGRSSCVKEAGTSTLCDDSVWVTEDGFNEKLRQYIDSQKTSETS
jgi:hypothetical protein